MTFQRVISSKSRNRRVFKAYQHNEWYLHHPVIHRHKSARYNGAAKYRGHSLHNALLTGLDLPQNLIQCYSVSASTRMHFLISRPCFAISWARKKVRRPVGGPCRAVVHSVFYCSFQKDGFWMIFISVCL